MNGELFDWNDPAIAGNGASSEIHVFDATGSLLGSERSDRSGRTEVSLGEATGVYYVVRPRTSLRIAALLTR